MRKILLSITGLLMSLSIFLLTSINVYADNLFNINDEDLYNETNTYYYKELIDENGNELNTINYNFNNDVRYDFSRPTGVDVETGEARITILTHGLGSTASDWSNDGNDNFAYNEDSLITRLYKKCDSYLYMLDFKSETNFKLYDLSDAMDNAVENEKFEIEDSVEIIDISKHIIIVFDAVNPLYPNDYIYTQFNYGISSILYQFKELNDGVLPKINLIGHSRGGITNLQYAIDHPDLIDSIYSIGTPYCGSTSASIDAYLFGHEFGGDEGGENDIVDDAVYSKYLNNWNNNYDNLYEDINVLALGGYSSFSFLSDMCYSESSQHMINYYTGMDINVIQLLAIVVDEVIESTESYIKLLNNGIDFNNELLEGVIRESIIHILNQFNFQSFEWIDDLVVIISREIQYELGNSEIAWLNDGLVDLYSQLGIYRGDNTLSQYSSYRGFNIKTKLFTSSNCDINKTARKLVSVVHNLETRDNTLLSYIMSDISMSDSSFETYDIDNNSIGILAYSGDCNTTTLTIPSVIDGKNVVEIGENAFSNNFYGNETITKVVIPNTIKEIKNSAFSNCSNLVEIDMTNATSLTNIESEAFYGCDSLLSLQIPSSLSSLGENVFVDSGIKNISISTNNSYFTVENNTLYDKNKNTLIFSPNVENLVVPSTVTKIERYAFYNNDTLKSINLSNVEIIEEGAFVNCSNLENITNGDNLSYANKSSFINTKWFDNRDDVTILGKVIIDYMSTNLSYEIPSNISYIGIGAFNSEELEVLYLGSNVEIIEQLAFVNCESLNSVYMIDVCSFTLYTNSFNENTNIYVPANFYSEYKNNVDYSTYNVCLKNQTVKFMLDDTVISIFEINFYGLVPNVIVEKEGYSFDHWVNNNKEYRTGNYLDIFSNDYIVMNAVMIPNEYDVLLEGYGIVTTTYGKFIPGGDGYKIEIPGYIFLGWEDANGNLYIDAEGNPSKKWDKAFNATLYPRKLPKTYHISYVLNGGENTTLSIINPTSYTIESKPLKLNSPNRFGYYFEGWEYEGVLYDSIPAGTYGDLVFTAKWSGTKISNSIYNTVVNANYSYSIIELPSSNFNNYCKINVSSSVKQLYIYSNSNITYKMYLDLSNAAPNFELYLHNLSFKAKDGTNAITMLNNTTLYLYNKGVVNIYGGDGTQVTTSTKDGSNGIHCYNLYIGGSGTLRVIGGNGANGVNGTNGSDGANGDRSPDGSFLSPNKGENGYSGTSGSNGSAGGDGGYGVFVNGYINISGSLNYAFIGGRGGDGGNGGHGGNGGNGASDTSTSIWNGVGDPGDGGNGGNGGRGGDGGDGSIGLNVSTYSSIRGNGGEGGDGGNGGAAGAGGSAGDSGSNGKNGQGGSGGVGGYGGSGETPGDNGDYGLDG